MNNILKRPDPAGPESVPINGYIKSYKVAVFIYNLKKDDEIIDCREIDYANREDRAWIGKVSYWAWTNGYSVETMSLADAEGKR